MNEAPTKPSESAEQDFLQGAAAIAAYLRSEGLRVTDGDVYYLAKSGKLQIGKLGKNLIASKKRLSHDLRRAAQAVPA